MSLQLEIKGKVRGRYSEIRVLKEQVRLHIPYGGLACTIFKIDWRWLQKNAGFASKYF